MCVCSAERRESTSLSSLTPISCHSLTRASCAVCNCRRGRGGNRRGEGRKEGRGGEQEERRGGKEEEGGGGGVEKRGGREEERGEGGRKKEGKDKRRGGEGRRKKERGRGIQLM